MLKRILEKLKGKLWVQAEHKGGRRDDFGPTKRYAITKTPEFSSEKQGFLILDSSKVQLEPGFLVGRGTSCHLKLVDPGASRVHASFTEVNGGWLVKDNSSRNGTLLNGKPIRSALLKSGDKIQIGQTLLIYEER